MVRKQILPAGDIPIDVFLEKFNNQEKQNKITFNITYHQLFLDVRKILEESHMVLASDDEYKKVFNIFPCSLVLWNRHYNYSPQLLSNRMSTPLNKKNLKSFLTSPLSLEILSGIILLRWHQQSNLSPCLHVTIIKWCQMIISSISSTPNDGSVDHVKTDEEIERNKTKRST